MHSAVDGSSRLAYTEALPDGKATQLGPDLGGGLRWPADRTPV
jgi:hypothetical protein